MFYPHNTLVLDAQTLTILSSELSHAVQTPAAKILLNGEKEALLARYIRNYQYLKHLPRKFRRQLQRQWKSSLAGVALLMALGQAPALAATINVNTTNPNIVADDRCSLIEAIDNANDIASGSVHSDCTAGDPSGADTIKLPPNGRHVLTTINNTTDRGNNGLPIITSTITIEGRGSTITRKSSAPAFGILAIERGNLTLNETTVSGGHSDLGSGINVYSGSLSLANSNVSNNTGIGIFSSRHSNVTLINCTVTGNTGSGISNGGIFNPSYGSLILTNSTVSGNNSSGIVNFSGDFALINSTVSGNHTTSSGGGIANLTYGYGVITNSTVSGNTAGGDGGGIYNKYDTSLTLTHSTISGNSAGNRGGGIFNERYDEDDAGRVSLNHILILGNTAPNGAEVFSERTNDIHVHADNFNLFGHNGNSGVVGFTPGPTDLVPSESVAQILSPTLASNGGPTLTHALPPTSPAVDASPDDEDCQATDQRGVSRPQDGNNASDVSCDIGAFELEPIPKFIYGVQDTDASKSQFFTIDKTTHAVSRLGSARNGRDIEGLDIHPTTQVLYGASGSANTFRQKGFLFSVDKTNGALTPIGPTGFNSIEALSFRPTNGSLWGWAEGKGLVKISLINGAATLILSSTTDIEGLAWDNAGRILYAAAGNSFFRYNADTNSLVLLASNLPGPAVALDMRPDGLLAVGVDGATAIKAYDPIAKQPVPAEDIPSRFNNVTGIAWPTDKP